MLITLDQIYQNQNTLPIVAFGDIHGCPLAAEMAIRLAEENKWRAVFLGDYVDKGERSVNVLELMMTAKFEHTDWLFLLGNHDQMLLDLIHGKRHPKGYDERTLVESFREYGILSKALQSDIQQFLLNLKLFHESNAFLFLHGGFKDPTSYPPQLSKDEIIWTYGIPANYTGKKVIRGHYPVEHPIYAPNNININTQCGYGGVLTGIVLDDIDGTILKCFQISEDGKKLLNW